MGHTIEANFEDILPGEDDFDELHLARVIQFAETNELLPIPVRELNGKYLHLDGRHSLMYHYLAEKEPLKLFLLDEQSDGMHNHNFPGIETRLLMERNKNIRGRWYSAEYIFQRLNVQNYIEHFENLKQKYSFLKDLKTCKEYLANKKIYRGDFITDHLDALLN